MSEKEYHLGLDIGTNSIGYAVMDCNYHLMRAKGKTLIGTSLFREGNTAAERRGYRTTRRRLKRRKRRLKLLEAFFDPYIFEVDENFLARLHEADISPKDENKRFWGSLLFPNEKDANFYRKYPTIYHLRKALMEEDRKFDVRAIFLAIHHIMKYRGNFLSPLSVDSFKQEGLELKEQLDRQLKRVAELYDELNTDVKINVSDVETIQDIIVDKNKSRRDKAGALKKLLTVSSDRKEINKLNASLAKELSNAILGMKAQFANLLLADDLEIDKNKKNFSLLDTNAEGNVSGLLELVNEKQAELFDAIKTIHDQIILNEIVPDGKSISQSMVDKYEAHREQLQVLKALYEKMDAKQIKAIKKAYSLYIDGKDPKAKKVDKRAHQNRADFYKEVKKVLVELDDSRAEKLLGLIEMGQFLPKQRTAMNGVIPNQLHQVELDKIIEMQSKYYPWLAEKNPVESHRKRAPYKLDELLTFRVPYYVGPMVTSKKQQQTSNSNFAWMVRKQGGEITPWNFEEKVDTIASANDFIKRMTAKDTYLVGEDVLPANSLLYQRYKVLNELNNIKVNGRRLSVELKREAYVALFENGDSKTVSAKCFKNWLNVKLKNLNSLKLEGLSTGTKFDNNLSTYHDLKKIFGKAVDDAGRQKDFEQIIEWLTIFEDKKILRIKLKEIEWLTEENITQLTRLNYNGWGRLSRRLLTGICDSNGQRIMDWLWDTTNNFMQIQSQPDFQKAIVEYNSDKLEQGDIEQILGEAYTSPQSKKAIRKVIKVVQDVEKAMGAKPTSISIEFTRSDGRSELTNSRMTQLQKTLMSLSEEMTDQALLAEFKDFQASKKKLTNKYYLYFTQLGRDMYTGEPLNIDQLSLYSDGDHILPRSFIKDDSLDNRVLTKRAVNNEKSDTVPVREYGAKMKDFWNDLYDNGLISKQKLANLLTDPDEIGPYKANGFIRRQLVETSQVIKLSAEILQTLYQDTKIIEVRQKYTHELREHFNFVKIRQLNDYHHAFDAYLTAFSGRYLYQRYPKLRGYFVYGDYNKFDAKKDRNYLKSYNFLYDLEEGKTDQIVDNVEHKVFMNRQDAINQLKKAYEYKYMLVSQETYTNSGAMFKETIYPVNPKQKLIQKKNDKPVDIYGGYSNNYDAYLSIVRLEDKKGIKFRVVGIPMRNKAELDNLAKEDHNRYMQRLNEIVDEQINSSGKKKTFRIILPKVHFKQLVEDDSGKFMLGSAAYPYNAKQLVLSVKSIESLANKDASDRELVAVYEEIVDVVDSRFKIYDTNKFRAKLKDSKKEFEKLSIQDKKIDLLAILDGLHASPMESKLKIIKGATPFGRLQRPSGIVLTENAKLIYQSPTGIFERVVYLRDL